jgi:hypothetical protein
MSKTISNYIPMKTLIRLSLLLLLGSFATLCFAQVEIHDWTNKSGRTIKAKFVSSDSSSVTIFLNGRNFVLKLTDLSLESQTLARKLSGPPLSPSVSSGKPASSAGSASSPTPSTKKPAEPVGKLVLPTLGSGKWANYHSVLEASTHDIALHGSGVFHLYLKEGSENLLQGRPLVLSFNHGYYSKPHPKGSVYAYHVSRSDLHYHYRKIIDFENPPEPSEKLGRLKLKAKLEGGVTMEISFEASARRIAIWGKADDPSSIEHPTVLALRLAVPESMRIKEGEGLTDWEPIVDDTSIEVVSSSGAKETIPYLEKWIDLKKKLSFSKGIDSAVTSGKLFGRREMTVAPKSLRNSSMQVGSYSAVFPFQHHRYYYQDKSGGEIDKNRRMEIEIK